MFINLTSLGNGNVWSFWFLLWSFNPNFPCVLVLLRAIRTSPRPRLRWLTRSPYPRCRSCRRPTTSTSTSTSPASELPSSSSAQGPHHNPPNRFSVDCPHIPRPLQTSPKTNPNRFSLDSHPIPNQSLISSPFPSESQPIPNQSLTDSHRILITSQMILNQFPTNSQPVPSPFLTNLQPVPSRFPTKFQPGPN